MAHPEDVAFTWGFMHYLASGDKCVDIFIHSTDSVYWLWVKDSRSNIQTDPTLQFKTVEYWSIWLRNGYEVSLGLECMMVGSSISRHSYHVTERPSWWASLMHNMQVTFWTACLLISTMCTLCWYCVMRSRSMTCKCASSWWHQIWPWCAASAILQINVVIHIFISRSDSAG